MNAEKIAAKKDLKLYNGAGWNPYEHEHAYVCAKSQSHAVHLINILRVNMSKHYFTNYWTKGCWGNTMNGIEPTVGVWVEFKDRSIKRLVGPWICWRGRESRAWDEQDHAEQYVDHMKVLGETWILKKGDIEWPLQKAQ